MLKPVGEDHVRILDGRLIAAGRALANVSVIELAKVAAVTPRTISRLEVDAAVLISPKRRHGHIAKLTLDRVIGALRQRGVELLPEGDGHGAGVRWMLPRDRRR